MVSFRSRKLEMLLGHELGDGLSYTHIQGLVGLAREAVDLDLKRY
jgi:hypothetical protein